MIKAGIIGSTGYAGGELVRILTGHKDVEIKWFGSRSYIDKKYADVYRNMFQIVDAVCLDDNMEQLADQVDVIFTATPQGLCASLVNEEILSKVKIIDLSADFRIKDVKTYEKWYGIEHKSPQFIEEAVYGLCEVNREDIKGARLIANPGCYATATELALIPLVASGLIETDSVIVDAKSGLTGAGKALSESSHFVNVHDNYVTYKLNHHQHIPEIVQSLQNFNPEMPEIQFSTSLLPVNRGIMATVYCKLKKDVTVADVASAFTKAYSDKPFVRVQDSLPELHNVIGSNFTDIGFAYNEKTNVLTVISVIDNLLKGASGQAVQNLNLMQGWDETEGLLMTPSYL